jgi:hypothetical protein
VSDAQAGCPKTMQQRLKHRHTQPLRDAHKRTHALAAPPPAVPRAPLPRPPSHAAPRAAGSWRPAQRGAPAAQPPPPPARRAWPSAHPSWPAAPPGPWPGPDVRVRAWGAQQRLLFICACEVHSTARRQATQTDNPPARRPPAAAAALAPPRPRRSRGPAAPALTPAARAPPLPPRPPWPRRPCTLRARQERAHGCKPGKHTCAWHARSTTATDGHQSLTHLQQHQQGWRSSPAPPRGHT